MKKSEKSLFVLFCMIFCSCKTIQKPQNITEPLDYTSQSVIQNEIDSIRKIQSVDSVKALWKSIYLGEEEIYNECLDIVLKNYESAWENKDFVEFERIKKSLEAIDFDFSKYESFSTLENEEKIPGFFVDESKLPKTIENCIDATVTVVVDKGIKVQYGNGISDIVIGSGFFIDNRGYIITNCHVIEDLVNPKYEGFSRLYIKLPSDMETKIPAKVIGYDSVLDLALLKTEIEPEFVFELGSSKDLSVGDKISAIGTPIGLEGTLTSGIISSIGRKLTTLGNVFQIDAAVNSGNSGGPLIDEKYKVQAIVFAGMLQFQGLNFAIPVEYLKQLLPIMYDGGEIHHPWIAAYGHTKRKGTEKVGVEVQYVMPRGIADISGLQDGDVIVQLNETKISTLEDLHFFMMGYRCSTLIKCKFVRNGEEKNTVLYLEERPESPLKDFYNSDFMSDSFVPIYGIKMIASSTINRKSYNIEKVIKGSLADEFGFSENDSLTVKDVRFDEENKYLLTQVFVQRRKKGYLDVNMILYAPYDSTYYF